MGSPQAPLVSSRNPRWRRTDWRPPDYDPQSKGTPLKESGSPTDTGGLQDALPHIQRCAEDTGPDNGKAANGATQDRRSRAQGGSRNATLMPGQGLPIAEGVEIVEDQQETNTRLHHISLHEVDWEAFDHVQIAPKRNDAEASIWICKRFGGRRRASRHPHGSFKSCNRPCLLSLVGGPVQASASSPRSTSPNDDYDAYDDAVAPPTCRLDAGVVALRQDALNPRFAITHPRP